MSSSYSELIALLTTQSHHGCSLKHLHYNHWKKSKHPPEVIKKEIENELKSINDIIEPVNCAIENLELFKSDLYQMLPKKTVAKEEKKLISFFTTMRTILNNLHKTNEITWITKKIIEELKANQFSPGLESSQNTQEPTYGQTRSYPNLPPKPSFNVISDYGTTGSKSSNYGMNRRASDHELLSKNNEIDSSTSTGVRKNELIRDGNRNVNDISNGEVSSAVSQECQHIYANFGDLPSTPDENNLACSEGSITPTNPDRSGSSTNDSSPSKPTSIFSSTNRDSAQFPALKSTKSYPGSPIAESLYSSTGTLSRPNKPAPPPPVRKTSSISNPNAITLGTLRNAGVSTYEEIKTLKRNVRNHSGGSNLNTYEELNSDKNAVYHAARKSFLSTSLTSLVEPIYSTLDSNTISHPFNSKIVAINTSTSRDRRDESKSYSQNHEPQQLSSSRPHSSSSSSTLSSHQYLLKPKDDDVLPPPPPEAYSDSENQQGYSSHNKIVYMRKEFLQTLNAKLSVVPKNQRASPKLVKRLSMSLPHSDQEWDSDSGVTSQSSSSNHSSSPGSTSNHSESFAHSLVKRFSTYGGRNSNNNSGGPLETCKSRNNSSSSNRSYSSNNSHSTNNSSFSFNLHKSTEIDSKNISHYDFGRGEIDNSNGSQSATALNSSQHSEVAKAAATEAMRRKKSIPDGPSSETRSRENEYTSHTPHNNLLVKAGENMDNNYVSKTNGSQDHNQYHQHHSNNSFHHYNGENMQTSNDSVHSSTNQNIYQSMSNQPISSSSGFSVTHFPQRRSSQPAALSLPNGRQLYNSSLLSHQPIPNSQNSNPTYSTNETPPSVSQSLKKNFSLPLTSYESINMHTSLSRHGSYSSESTTSSSHSSAANENIYSVNQNNQNNMSNNLNSSAYYHHLPQQQKHQQQFQSQQTTKIHSQIGTRNQNSGPTGTIESLEGAIAARVHNLLANRGSVDLISCRENLMDQIRKGKQLRKVNDQ